LANRLEWTDPVAKCPDAKDVAGYRIYYAAEKGQALKKIGENNRATARSFEHRPEFGLIGCYAVSAVDFLGNESPLSDTICVDNCPRYELPNAFTPNGDGQNDQFVPYPFCFIDRVDFKVFNRWGQLVFEASDPQINWDGRNLAGDELPAGAYFFVCRVFEQRLGGEKETAKPLSGYIQLVR
jgi:gliding motility-associated-like protein